MSIRFKSTERRIDELEAGMSVGGHVIEDNGMTMIQRPNLNFIGSGATLTDNSTTDSTDVYVNEIPSTINLGFYAQTELGNLIVYSSREASLIGSGVGTLSVPKNAFKVGDSFVVKMCGVLSCENNEILHIHIRSNGNIIINALAYTMPKCTDQYWDIILDFTITKLGAFTVGELFANGVFTYNKDASKSVEGTHFGQVSNLTFDTTVVNTLDITAQWLTSADSNKIQSQNFVLNKTY